MGSIDRFIGIVIPELPPRQSVFHINSAKLWMDGEKGKKGNLSSGSDR